jgi:uncharacterized membrane protein YeaQ/YmgE (transglycosylase-associated protein family)
MTLPSIILGIFISSLYGAIFHLWRGGNGGKLFLYLIFSWIGFWLGQIVGDTFDLAIGNLGPLHLVSATLGSLVILGIGYWLSLIDTNETQ